MRHLVYHFGEREAEARVCGSCDFCAPEQSLVLRFTQPTTEQLDAMRRIVQTLIERDDQATGRLHRELFGEGISRNECERLIGALARAGVTLVRDDAFERDGRVIHFRRVRLTSRGRQADALDDVSVPVDLDGKPSPARRARTRSRTRAFHQLTVRGTEASEEEAPAELVERLREWRLTEARRRGLPAFCILSNRDLTAIARSRPTDESSLLQVRGMGPKRVGDYGEAILQILRSTPNPSG
jgi:DNA topoisomerase-3